MTTKQIDYCIELAHTLNFSRAADNMFVSQPTLTYQIKLLEDEVGFAIYSRQEVEEMIQLLQEALEDGYKEG